jgi:hypothetical protein
MTSAVHVYGNTLDKPFDGGNLQHHRREIAGWRPADENEELFLAWRLVKGSDFRALGSSFARVGLMVLNERDHKPEIDVLPGDRDDFLCHKRHLRRLKEYYFRNLRCSSKCIK